MNEFKSSLKRANTDKYAFLIYSYVTHDRNAAIERMALSVRFGPISVGKLGRSFVAEHVLFVGARWLGSARAAHVMAVSVACLDECVLADWTLELLLLIVGFLMINHVAELCRLNVTFQALENLISTACCWVDHVVFLEAHMAGICPESIPDALLDLFFDGRYSSWLLDRCFVEV